MEFDKPRVEPFVSKGLLPENLPPAFDSASLWNPLKGHDKYIANKSLVGTLAVYDASKRGGQRREFAVPYPVFIHDQALFFREYWTEIETLFAASPGSTSRPSINWNRYRAAVITPQSELPKIRLSTLASKKYCLVTDVSRYFHSVYTHTIPWALNGKADAKKDRDYRSATVWGNRLDFSIRNGQDGQTVGIPVGPDASRIVSEILLSSVDRDFITDDPRVKYVRHVDDYWIGGDSIEDCERHLQRLRARLIDLRLDVNDSKTRIVETSELFRDHWPADLKERIENLFSRYAVKERDIMSLYAQVVDLSKRTADQGIVKYAIRTIDRNQFWSRDWSGFENFLALCATQFPHSLDYVFRVVAWRHRRYSDVNRSIWREIALGAGRDAATLARDAELCWSLWLLKELGYKIPEQLAQTAFRMCGPISMAFLVRLTSDGHVTQRNLLNDIENSVVSRDLYMGRNWPVTLELFYIGHDKKLRAERAPDGSWKSKFHESGCHLIDMNAKPKVFEDVDDEGQTIVMEEPDMAIEDFTSSYDDEEDEEDDAFNFPF